MRSIKLHELLSLVGIVPTSRLINTEINNISFNSKEVEKGTLFLGLPGLNVDGGKYWREAIENGAEKISQTSARMACINYCAPGNYITVCWHLSV